MRLTGAVLLPLRLRGQLMKWEPNVGKAKLRVWRLSATPQMKHNHCVPRTADSPTQKIHCKDRSRVSETGADHSRTNWPRRRASSQASTGSRPVTSLYQAGWKVHAQASLTAPRIIARNVPGSPMVLR